MTSKFCRKTSYKSKVYNSDYFVNKHLDIFISNYIEMYIQNKMKVADIGCGEQPLRSQIENRGAQYFGIDIVQNELNNVDLITSITSVPLPDNHFDCVICTEVLEHVFDTRMAFAEIARLLKPGGVCAITTPFIYPLHEEPYDHYRFSPHSIRTLAQQNQLIVNTISATGNKYEVAATLLGHILQNKKSNIFTRVLFALVRTVVNAIATLLSSARSSDAQDSVYLNTVAVLVKHG